MTSSTFDVAVCCSSDSRVRNSFSSRAFSMAMTAWSAKFVDQLDLLFGEWPYFLAVNDRPIAIASFSSEQRHAEQGPKAAKLCNRVHRDIRGRPDVQK